MKNTKTILSSANIEYKNGNFEEALALYKQAITDLEGPLKKAILFNIDLCQKKIHSPLFKEKTHASTKIQLSNNEKDTYVNIKGFNINWDLYFQENKHDFVSSDPIEDYIKTSRKHHPVIPNFFDTKYYLEVYPDILASEINPLEHFLLHGKEEGRKAFFDTSKIKSGKTSFDSTKETIVLVSHESSATGAPLLGLNMIYSLQKDFNIVNIVLQEKNIHKEFLDCCFLMYENIKENISENCYFFLKKLEETTKVKCIIVNSIAGHHAIYAGKKLHIPILTLIHEFSEYTRPFGTVINTVISSNVVVVPAKIIMNSVISEFSRFRNHKETPKNLYLLPQGKLPYKLSNYGENKTVEELYAELKINSDVRLIVGSGYVQMRKGVDLFLLVAKYFNKIYSGKFKFVWVGDGFHPDEDLAYSIYLNHEIKNYGLGNKFQFLGHQRSLDTLFSIADVFCLPSRMDPFPNVVIDALAHDLHVACFDNGTGCAEFLKQHNANATITDLSDVYAMAQGIADYLYKGNTRTGINKLIADNQLSFDLYIKKIKGFILLAEKKQKEAKMIVDFLIQSKEFDADFFSPAMLSKEKKCQIYVDSAMAGLYQVNPKPGFSNIKWLEENGQKNEVIVPLYEAVNKGNTVTHKLEFLGNINSSHIVNFIYAVHIHLFYLDLADEFISYLYHLPGTFDLYVTIVDSNAKEDLRKKFKNSRARNLEIIVVENIGRDVIPFIKVFKQIVKNPEYSVIGHFHTKKSVTLNGVGDKWRNYLMNHLIGDEINSRSVLSLFNDEKIGLVYPEDSNCVGVGENLEFIKDLCEFLSISKISQTSPFPLGNMFWARCAAIKQFAELNIDLISEPEPLPYDGSYMHALERITPHLVKFNGYNEVCIWKKTANWNHF